MLELLTKLELQCPYVHMLLHINVGCRSVDISDIMINSCTSNGRILWENSVFVIKFKRLQFNIFYIRCMQSNICLHLDDDGLFVYMLSVIIILIYYKMWGFLFFLF